MGSIVIGFAIWPDLTSTQFSHAIKTSPTVMCTLERNFKHLL